MKLIIISLLLTLIGSTGLCIPLDKEPLIKIKVQKTGAYLGLQAGKFYVFEFGGEHQWHRLRLNNPITHAVHTGVNYNFKYNVIGYDIGYWYKPNRLGLTYGANLVYRTDFTHNHIGVAPVIGFKFWQFHLQTGYHLLAPRNLTYETNTLFISLRFVMINNRDWDIQWRKRPKN